MSLQQFAASNASAKPGFPGVMDRIDPKHREEAVDGYHQGISGPTIRAWLQSLYPEIRFTSSNVDLWLSKHHPRFTRG